MKPTFEDLNKKIAALRIIKLNFDYLKSEVVLEVKPEYGYKPEFEGKEVRFVFSECIYFSSINVMEEKYDQTVEVVSWGRSNSLKVDNRMITKGLVNFELETLTQSFDLYFFENVFGDSVQIIAKSVVVNIVK